ncbi:Kynurenine formamidase [Abditibacterium utsteinense]|uniref:Kynurenine formamidase n=1 Tax=Abditibacterium utsteinense TaxID=1960156 RepID=A0A2S8SSI1_9BACT|nr:cyclase family protein [Abditibacterium utsteinense]PQV63760.1 Kynurenine formamidase [Abditibacterium utsteinense]
MKFLDLSQPLFDACPNCPAHPKVKIRTENHVAGAPDDDANSWQIEFLDFASHTGSHIDAPRHKLPGGATLDDLSLDIFAGRAFAADLRPLSNDAAIGRELLEICLPDDLQDAIVLLCTGWGDKRAASQEWLHHAPFLSSGGAQFLVEKKVRGVGIDHYSIGGIGAQNPLTHQILLGAGVWIAEELRFPDEVWSLSSPLQFMALPIHLRGASGAPCRPVLLLQEENR